jgi:hypothetical protein
VLKIPAIDSLQLASAADAARAVATVTLTNAGKTSGQALPFNLLASDQRKDEARQNSLRNPICDLQSVGYRVIEKDSVKYLQVGVKLYNPVTTWHLCEISIQIDANATAKLTKSFSALTPRLSRKTQLAILVIA